MQDINDITKYLKLRELIECTKGNNYNQNCKQALSNNYEQYKPRDNEINK